MKTTPYPCVGYVPRYPSHKAPPHPPLPKRSEEKARCPMRKNLQTARKAAGLTQQEMADKLGIGLRTFWGYINGYSERPQIIIPAQQKVSRDVKQVSDFYEHRKVWLTICALVLLIRSERHPQGICGPLERVATEYSGRSKPIVKHCSTSKKFLDLRLIMA